MDVAYISELVKNLEPEVRARGRAINWNRANYSLYDPSMIAVARGDNTPEQLDAAISAGASECTPTFETDTLPIPNLVANAIGTSMGQTDGRSSTGPSSQPAQPLGDFSIR